MSLEGFYDAFTLFSQGSTMLLKGFWNENKDFTWLLECLFEYFLKVFTKSFTRFYKPLARFLQGFTQQMKTQQRFFEGSYEAFTVFSYGSRMALPRLSQGFQKVVRRLLEGSWRAFIRLPQALRRRLEGSSTAPRRLVGFVWNPFRRPLEGS